MTREVQFEEQIHEFEGFSDTEHIVCLVTTFREVDGRYSVVTLQIDLPGFANVDSTFLP